MNAALQTPRALSMNNINVGVDLVSVTRIAESLESFGDRFLTRIFTPAEIAYASSADAPFVTHQRLAARFAAKEAALKALGLVNEGVSWRDIEVERLPSGACKLQLHGRARSIVHARHARQEEECTSDVIPLSLSLSHEGDLATAMVVAQTP